MNPESGINNRMTDMKRLVIIKFILLALNAILVPFGFASSVVEYKLTISYKTINITGKDVTTMSLNDFIPGPTLGFRG